MNYETLAYTIVSAAIGFLSTWGMVKRQVADSERRIDKLEKEKDISDKEYSNLLERIHSLREVYVSQQHFNEIMSVMRESQRELRDDVKRVLELLTERA